MHGNNHSFQIKFFVLFSLALVLAGCAQATPPPTATAVPTSTREPIAPTPTLAPLSVETRKNTFEAIWMLVRNRYVYADFGGVDWDAVHAEFVSKVEAAESSAAFYSLMDEMLGRLPDASTYFQTPQEVQAEQAPADQFYGIGAHVATVPEGGLITRLVPDAPAARAGLKAREIILEVNGTRFVEDPAFGPDGPISMIRGPAGTPVDLKIQGVDGNTRLVKIIRQPILNADVLDLPRSQRIAGTKVGYIELAYYYTGLVQAIKSEIVKLERAGPLDGLILDLRHAEGGELDVIFNTLSLFIESQSIGHISTRDSKTERRVVADGDTAQLKKLPLVILVDQDTYPIIPAILQNLKRARVVGVASNVGSEVAISFAMLDGSNLQLATQVMTLPDGKPIRGAQPDRVVDEKWYLVPFEEDPQIKAALKELKQP